MTPHSVFIVRVDVTIDFQRIRRKNLDTVAQQALKAITLLDACLPEADRGYWFYAFF